MRRLGALLLLVAALGVTGCHRTVYRNLAVPGVASEAVPVHETSRWQHFFVYGWLPGERVIDARAACGGTHRIQEIRTRETFVQGLIEAFAGYYVNIYSPYTGEVVCR